MKPAGLLQSALKYNQENFIMKRIFLFLATNLAIVLVLSITMRLLGVEPYLNEQGLNLTSLLIFAAIMGMGGSFISLAISKWTAKRAVGAQVIESPRTPEEIWLVNTVQRQAQAAGIGMPEVAIYDSPEVNAFATGMNKNNALVAVSTGLLRNMTREEAEAVLGHEVSHVANGDMVTLALIQGVVNTFVMFLSRVIGHVVDRVVFKTERGHGPAFFVTMIVAEMVLGILASMIVMWFSRQREFRADHGGATLAGRQKMIAALQALQRQHPQPLPDKMAAFGISGGMGGGLKRLFMTHPPLEERIAALQAAG
jgi:heat shock protein HtpX